MRCIDDLLVLNNIELDKAILDIYPSELQLKKTIESLVMDSWAAMSPHIESPMGSVCDWTYTGVSHYYSTA